MKAISLWQPWASAMALGSKLNETRHWSTKYRGPLAIHAAKRRKIDELIFLGSHWGWIGALNPRGVVFGKKWKIQDELPFGALLAVGNLVDCRPTGSFTDAELDEMRYPADDKRRMYGWTERRMGNYELGRFGWVFEGMKLLPEPIPFVGRQGLFNVPDELIKI
jgi:hypothetical protein